MAEFEPVVRTAELGPGEMREVEVRGEPLLVTNVGQTYYVLSAHCPRDGTDLAREGRIEDDDLVCPVDGQRYDLRTGESIHPRGAQALTRYSLRVEENVVKVGPRLPPWRAGAA
jgi:nitrite reductase/ring-hydroxylating ferredoxin subunit